MEIEGKITQVLPEQSGEGRNGTWKKQEFILETMKDKFPKQVCISTWGDVIDQLKAHSINAEVRAYIDVSSREYNGRWYTDVKAWKIDALQTGGASGSQRAADPASAPLPEAPPAGEAEDDDLPF